MKCVDYDEVFHHEILEKFKTWTPKVKKHRTEDKKRKANNRTSDTDGNSESEAEHYGAGKTVKENTEGYRRGTRVRRTRVRKP